ncbi:MAG: metal ABC transporter permease [Syntrophorhabdaceae bacterium]|nr:metal ABC transporter permease [Syntrophorhabdaceae bacterium]
MEIFEPLNHAFIQRAIIAGSFIAILCSTLGVFLVLRRLSLIGDGLSHVAFGAVSFGLLLKVYPFYVALPIVMLGALGILKLIDRARVYGDAAIGIVSSMGIATGVIVASKSRGFNVDLFNFLFGNILSISKTEVFTSLLFSAILIGFIVFFYNELLSITFDEETARASGIKIARINAILFIMTGLTVVLAMRMVGIMLVSALLIIPSVTSLQFGLGFKWTLILSSFTGVLSVVAGIFISFHADLPSGATIVLLNFFFFAGGYAYKILKIKS